MATKKPDRGLPAKKARQAAFLDKKQKQNAKPSKDSEGPPLKGQSQGAQKTGKTGTRI